jgi:hypothetical protein
MDEMSTTKAEILDICLTRIQSGDSTIEDCLNEFPDHAGALAPLLEIAIDVRSSLAPSDPRNTFISTSYVRFLNRLRIAQRQPHAAKKIQALRRKWIWRPAYSLASILVVFALLMTSVGVAYASSDALPGDLIYGVKRGIEEARLALTWSPTGDSELLTGFADERLAEIERLISAGREEDIEVSLAGYEDIIDRLVNLAEDIPLSVVPGSLEHVVANISRHIDTLERVRGQVPAAAQKGIDSALEHSRHGQEVIQQVRAGESPRDLAPGQQKKTPDLTDGNQEDVRGKPTKKTPKPKREDKTPGPPPWVTKGPLNTQSP